MMEGLPRRAIRRFKLLMNSLVSRLGSKSRNTARVKLQEKRTMYDLAFVLLLRYFTGPAKSTPITYRDHRPIQYFSFTFAITIATPPCSVDKCALCTIFVVNSAVSGKYIGYSPWIRPWHSQMPSSFNANPNCSLSSKNFTSLTARSCVCFTRTISCFMISSVVIVPEAFVDTFRQLLIKRVTHPRILKALHSSNFSIMLSEVEASTATAAISRRTLFSASLTSLAFVTS